MHHRSASPTIRNMFPARFLLRSRTTHVPHKAKEAAERQLEVLKQAMEQFAVEKHTLESEQRKWEQARAEWDAVATQDFLQRLRRELQEVQALKELFENKLACLPGVPPAVPRLVSHSCGRA